MVDLPPKNKYYRRSGAGQPAKAWRFAESVARETPGGSAGHNAKRRPPATRTKCRTDWPWMTDD
jgi:hypothetical protein